MALNIQRGREHGIPSYNAFRQLCGLPKAVTFDDLSSEMDAPAIASLQMAYESVDDVDLYIGGLSELPALGAVVGPIAQCIIGEQFLRLKKGDRFFYENGNRSTSFTYSQLTAIRSASLARIICDNNDGAIGTMQPLAFRNPEES